MHGKDPQTMLSTCRGATTTLSAELATARLASNDLNELATVADRTTRRLSVELPSGEHFVPRRSAGCLGPDAVGACSRTCSPAERPCAGAIWQYHVGRLGWEFVFRVGSRTCPLALLDPLGQAQT